ncbi:hypothetical protein HY450_02715 [Candidatus Pacearchaeota archaeon]|nr:hypothetical protein [Candidatus Pacearchaeota archaeon]
MSMMLNALIVDSLFLFLILIFLMLFSRRNGSYSKKVEADLRKIKKQINGETSFSEDESII